MTGLRLLPLLLLAWPIAEIATFIWVGGRIGLWQTILLVVAAGLIGTALVRAEGLRVLAGIQRDMAEGKVPAEKVLHAALIAVAGLLLLLPGFLSDVPGLLLLLPPVRSAVIRLVAANATVVTGASFGRRRYRRDGVVDLDPSEYDAELRPREDVGGPGDGAGTREPPRLGGG